MRRKSELEWLMNRNINTVWQVVTNNQDYTWRSDIERLEILSEKQFIEYYQAGSEVDFTIVESRAYEVYRVAIRSKFFTGYWTGRYEELSMKQTRLNFTERADIF